MDTPMVEKFKLDEDPQGKAVDPTRYHGMIGTLMYLTSSIPDLVFVVCMCARYQAKPTEKHLHVVHLKEEGKPLEEAYYTQFGRPFQGGGYRATASRFYQRNNANPSYQERRQSMEDTLSKFMSESAKKHKENSNLIKEIQASTDATICNQGASIKTLEIQIGQMSKVLQERGFGSLPRSTEVNTRDQVKSISTTIEVDSYPIRRIGSSQYAVSTRQSRTLMYEMRQTTVSFLSRLNGYYCEEKKGSYRPQFSEAYSEASRSIP
ncbi:hypothetical protein Tco_0103750 [Tanacetum coccineum]